MEPLVRTRPDEAAELAMENELLRYEAVHLRARLAEAEKAVARAERALERQREKLRAAGSADASAEAEQQRQRKAQRQPGPGRDEARDDLVWLLERLDRSPAGPLVRRKEGFRALRDKYLGGSRG